MLMRSRRNRPEDASNNAASQRSEAPLSDRLASDRLAALPLPQRIGAQPLPGERPPVALNGAPLTTRGPVLRVVTRRGKSETRAIYPVQRPKATIGRDPANDIVIHSPLIPERFAEIHIPDEGQPRLVITDPDVQVYYRGAAVGEHALTPGDHYDVGQPDEAPITLVYEDHDHLAAQLVQSAEQRIGLTDTQDTSMGRGHNNQLVLDHPEVAEHHIRITQNARGEYEITDLGSATGTYVNGMRVPHARLMPGAEVRIGQQRFIFNGTELVQYDEASSIRIDAANLRETVSTGFFGLKKKVILDNVSLTILPGSFVALVGASGAGKTTLLNALNGLKPAQQGVVLYNDKDFYDNMAEFAALLGYVPQDDIIHKNLTVERALYYAARLRLPRGTTRKQIKQRITEVLDDIEMEPQRHQLVSKLSGGQRKRVSIGVELLAHPAVFFLDEPTSGLDPGLDRRLMQLLRRLADRGHTIVLSTHATADVSACDFVCFLAQGGRLAYYGPPELMKQFFEKDEYADIYNAVHDDPDYWVARFRQSPEYLQYVASPQLQSQSQAELKRKRVRRLAHARQASQLRQFLLLTRRYMAILSRDRMNLAILLAQAPIIAGLVVLLANKNIIHYVSVPALDLRHPQDIYSQTVLFIMAVSAVWFGIINAAREIVKEAPIYQRERAIGLGLLPYVFSKLTVLGMLSAVQSFILLVIVTQQSGYPAHGLWLPGPLGGFWEEYISLFLMAVVGMAMGLLISALAPNADRAISIVPIALLPQIIFANVIFTLSGAGTWISYIVAARWGEEALGSIGRLHDRFTNLQGQHFYNPNASHLLGYWGALIGLGVVCLLLTALFQRRKDIVRHHHSRH